MAAGPTARLIVGGTAAIVLALVAWLQIAPVEMSAPSRDVSATAAGSLSQRDGPSDKDATVSADMVKTEDSTVTRSDDAEIEGDEPIASEAAGLESDLGVDGIPRSATTAASGSAPSAQTEPATRSGPTSLPRSTGTGDTTHDNALSDAELSVDLFRVEADGSGIVAGRAAPGAAIDVLLDGVSVGSGGADGAGNFVSLFSAPPGDAPHVLTLSTQTADGERQVSGDSFIVQPDRSPEATSDILVDLDGTGASKTQTSHPDVSASVRAAPSGGGGVTPLDVPARTAVTDQTQSPPAIDTTATNPEPPKGSGVGGIPSQRYAAVTTPPTPGPVILRRDQSGLSVIQSIDPAPNALDSLSIDTITYAGSGAVSLGGRAGADRPVRVYVDNRPVNSVVTTRNGQWRVALPPLNSQVYTLRVDTLADDGSVLARAETPFRPEEPSALARLTRDADGNEIALVTVQPGFTLWRIADENYGDGFSYVRVFEANADKIRDPDLIYPGQVLTVPD